MEEFEVKLSKFKTWGFTYKKMGGTPSSVKQSDYDVIICKLKRFAKCNNVEFIFEYDPSGRLHIHGIITLDKQFLRTKLKHEGFNFYMEELYNQTGWTQYMMKQQTDESEIIEKPIKRNLFKSI